MINHHVDSIVEFEPEEGKPIHDLIEGKFMDYFYKHSNQEKHYAVR